MVFRSPPPSWAGRALSVSDYPHRHGVDVLGQGREVVAQAQDRAFADELVQASQGLGSQGVERLGQFA